MKNKVNCCLISLLLTTKKAFYQIESEFTGGHQKIEGVLFIRRWLDLLISATLSGIILSKNQLGLNLILPSVKFMQCQTVYCNALKSSPNKSIQSLWKNTSQCMNIQYDVYRNTREVLKAV